MAQTDLSYLASFRITSANSDSCHLAADICKLQVKWDLGNWSQESTSSGEEGRKSKKAITDSF